MTPGTAYGRKTANWKNRWPFTSAVSNSSASPAAMTIISGTCTTPYSSTRGNPARNPASANARR